jgi:hypothetical protein
MYRKSADLQFGLQEIAHFLAKSTLLFIESKIHLFRLLPQQLLIMP